MPLALVLVFAGAFGGALGSYAGVVAERGMAGSLAGRSKCNGCGRTLQWYELVPLVSYVVLRGRCRTCGAHISWATYLWEMGGAAIAVAIALTVLLTTGGNTG